MPNPVATARRRETLPPARPSTRQASRTKTWAKLSAAKCYVLRRQKLQDAKLFQAQSQHENTQAHNSVNFKYSAENPAASVPSSTTNTDLGTQAYRGNTVSHLHYLERKIKVMTSKIESYNHDSKNDIKLINSKISAYARDIDRRVEVLIANTDSHGDIVREVQKLKGEQESHAHNLDKKLKSLNDSYDDAVKQINNLIATKESIIVFFTKEMEKLKAEEDSDSKIRMQAIGEKLKEFSVQRYPRELDMINSHADDLYNQIELLTAEKDAHAEDLGVQIQLLSAREDSSARTLVRRWRLLIAMKNSYCHDLSERINCFHGKKDSYDHDIIREHGLLCSKLATFAHDLHRQIEALNLKLVPSSLDFKKQRDQLDSDMTSFVFALNQRIKLLHRDITLVLGGLTA